MADNKTIRENFFDSLSKGAKWDVGVSINRTNPLPLDQYSVFESETALDAYIAGAFSYPGQIVALIKEDETVIYYLDQNKEKQEVGSMPGVDGKSIKIETDAEGNEYLTLVGLKDAKEGASLVKGADGTIGWSVTTQSELNAELEDIKADIIDVEKTVYGYEDEETKEFVPGHESKIKALEDKFASLGGIFNYKGSIEVGVDETINDKIDFIPVSGDVVLVNGTQEYVYAEDKWEPFGDPHGVEAIDERVTTLEEKVDGYTTEEGTKVPGLIEKVEDIKEEIGKEAEGETPASGIYAYVDEVATEKANAAQTAAELTAANALSPVAAQVEQNKTDIAGLSNTKADKQELTNAITPINEQLSDKATKSELNAVKTTAEAAVTQSQLQEGLSTKADVSIVNTVNTNAQNISKNATDLSTLSGTVTSQGETISGLTTTVGGHITAIGSLTSNLGTKEDGADADTAFGKAAAANALADKGVKDAATAQAKADSAYTLADEGKTLAGTAKSAADAAQGDATKALADAAKAQEQADKGVADAATAQGVADSALAAANTKAEKSFVGDLPSGTSATTVVGYVDAEIDKVEKAIEDIHIPNHEIILGETVWDDGENTKEIPQIQLIIDDKLDSAIDVMGEGIINAFADSSTIVISADLSDYYTKNETDAEVKKVDDKVAAMYTNAQIDGFIADAKKYADDNDANTEYGIVYDSDNKVIKLVSDTSKTEIDATDFIKDGMIESVTLDETENELVITWNTDSDKGENNITRIPLEGLVDVYTGVDGTTVKVEVSSDNKISAEVKAGTIAKSHLDSSVQASLDLADNWGTAPAKGITADDIAAWDAEKGAMDLAKTKRTEAEVDAQIDAKITAQNFGTMAKKAASDYYTKTEADAAFTDATEVDNQIDAKIEAYGFGTMAKASADTYYTKTEADKVITDLGLNTMSQKDANDYYTKSEVYNKTETESAIENALADALEWGTF